MSSRGFKSVCNAMRGRTFTSQEAAELFHHINFNTKHDVDELPADMLIALIAILHYYATEGETLDELLVRAKLSMS